MFVNKIGGIAQNVGFKGYQHKINDVGDRVMRFNYPYDNDKEECAVQIFRAVPTDSYNYKIIETPVATIPLRSEGVDINIQDITNLDKDDAFAYRVVIKNKETGEERELADTGVKIKKLEINIPL